MSFEALKLPIYLDYHATTPVDPEVLEAMLPYFCQSFGNPASRSHEFGWIAEAAVENGRLKVAHSIKAQSEEIIFTSGATESNNLALVGVAERYREKGTHIITSLIEHKTILETCSMLSKKGFHITYLPVDRCGRVSMNIIKDLMTSRTILLSLSAANHEIGTLYPITELGQLCKEKGVLFHCDASQAIGKIALDVEAMKIDLLSLSAHKVYGPKGIGALYVRRRNPRVQLQPILYGGGQERGLRSGTLNVPGIVGFGKAMELAGCYLSSETERISKLRNQLWSGIQEALEDVFLNGPPFDERLSNNLNISFSGVEGDTLLMSMRGELSLSSSSACVSGSLESSYVLKSIGVDKALAESSIRFGLGRYTTQQEVNYVIQKIVATVRTLRERSPVL